MYFAFAFDNQYCMHVYTLNSHRSKNYRPAIRMNIVKSVCEYIIYIEGNFHTVQTFVAVFTDDPTTAKLKTAEIFIAQLVLHYTGFVAKVRIVKIFSGASLSGGIFAKVFTLENFLLYSKYDVYIRV